MGISGRAEPSSLLALSSPSSSLALNTTMFTKFPMYHWEDNVNVGSKMLREFRQGAEFLC